MKLIVVEDESITALFIKKTLEKLGQEVVAICDKATLLYDALEKNSVDLVFMDLEIKGSVDGIMCAKKLKDEYSVPVIYITSYKDSPTMEEAMKVKPLGYLVKPVLESDIEAAFRVAQMHLDSSPKAQSSEIRVGLYTLSLEKKTIYDGNKAMRLSKNVYKAASLMFKHKGAIISTEQLSQEVWGEPAYGNTSKLRDLMYRVRKEFPEIRFISHHQQGYSIEVC